jgi:hypothetical protein
MGYFFNREFGSVFILFSKKLINYLLGSKFLFSVMIFLALPSELSGIDLFETFALPEFPFALKHAELEEKNSRLKIKTQSEELYRKWINGNEASRFDANRSRLNLRVGLNSNFFVEAEQQFKGRQSIMNRDTEKAPEFDFANIESFESIALSYRGAHNFIQIRYYDLKDQLNGNIELEDSAKDAIGGNPGLKFTSKRFYRQIEWLHRKNDWVFSASLLSGKGSDIAKVKPVNMKLEIPLARTESTLELEACYRYSFRVKPFLRYASTRITGNGESYKNEKFRFGFTKINFKQQLYAFGVAFCGRYDWFFELQSYRLSASANAKNNLITLNPVMLFGINEVSLNENLPISKPVGFRIGASRHFSGVETALQYSFYKADSERFSTQQKISNFRKNESNTIDYVSETLKLHRLHLKLVRPDSSGKWQCDIRLMVPETISRKVKEPVSPVAPPVTPALPEPSERIRGGWQISLIREFFL